VTFLLKKGTGHRLGVIMRGEGLSAKITDPDPHCLGVKVYKSEARDDSREAKFTAKVLNKFLENAHELLAELPSNQRREKEGKFPANYVLVRGAGEYPRIPSFRDKYGLKSVCIAGAGLYKGIGRILGMDVVKVKGATGKPESDIIAKSKKAVSLQRNYDFFFIHFKGADTLGEDGDYEGKKKFIEKIDAAIKPLMKVKNALILVTADHSTPCVLKAHSADDVPVLIHSRHVRDDDVEHFNERESVKGRLGHIFGLQLMPIVLDLMGIAELFGA